VNDKLGYGRPSPSYRRKAQMISHHSHSTRCHVPQSHGPAWIRLLRCADPPAKGALLAFVPVAPDSAGLGIATDSARATCPGPRVGLPSPPVAAAPAGVPHDMLLGYIVSQRGIEPNPEKVAALNRMGPIRDLKGSRRCWGALPS
jgi:hypothetical protein